MSLGCVMREAERFGGWGELGRVTSMSLWAQGCAIAGAPSVL